MPGVVSDTTLHAEHAKTHARQYARQATLQKPPPPVNNIPQNHAFLPQSHTPKNKPKKKSPAFLQGFSKFHLTLGVLVAKSSVIKP
jgi:hypothetical protein